MSEDSRFAFLVEWYDPWASIVRPYQLFYYAKDASVEMFDMKLRRPFLKKTKIPDIRLSDLYIGSSIDILSRQINIVDFGDDYTRQKLSAKTEKTLVILPLVTDNSMGLAMETVESKGLLVVNLKTVMPGAVSDFARITRQRIPFTQSCLVMEVVGADAILQCSSIFPTAFVSGSQAQALREIDCFFGDARPQNSGTATISRRATCALIRPHAIAAGIAGKIVSAIVQAGFRISAARIFHLDRSSAEEFLEIYKGVVNEYSAMVAQLTSGACLALEIQSTDGEEAYSRFRNFVGPPDPEIARHLRPETLRARFGNEKVTNAIHCTDLPEDTVLELQYFFQLLDN